MQCIKNSIINKKKLNQMFFPPINDFRFPNVAVICAETPKSASLTSALSVSKIFAPCCQYNLVNTMQKYCKKRTHE